MNFELLHSVPYRVEFPQTERCPICRHSVPRWFQAHGYWIRHCANCEHCFAEITSDLGSVESIYGDDYFFGGGVGYPDYLGEQDLLIEHGRRYARRMQRWMQPGRVLDVGAAAGFVLKGFAGFGWETQGIEPNSRLAAYGREQIGVPISSGTMESFATDAPFDLITMLQVVGHFRDVRRAFEVAARITRPGGYWLIETWNYRSMIAQWLGRHWHEWSPPSVLQWFSPQSLAALGSQFGLHVVAQGRPKKRIRGDHARSLLKVKLRGARLGDWVGSILDLTVPSRLTIPYPAEDLFWVLLRSKHNAGDQVS